METNNYKRRRRQIDAEQIPVEVIPDMIQSIDLETYAVKSFTNSIVTYEVKVREQKMASCSCRDFSFNRNNCKHMFLLNRLHPTLGLYTGKHYLCFQEYFD
ncbi:hypothetical protein BC941DRAFT_441581 [Chlamydoabsidia padenii]|nr:hypothetical protein BC941DRAFT_441581 [Chlamydoabsidia padenii]